MALPSSSDWASLPMNLLDSILDCLVPTEDYLTFSEVCIEWQYAVGEKLQHLRSNHKRHCRLHQKAPLLMAPTTDNTKERCCLYDVMKGKSLWEFQLSLGRWKCEGSSHGWLILVEDDSYKVDLLNPYSLKLIHLPPLEKPWSFEYSGHIYEASFPSARRRSVLSIDPDVNRDEFVLMMTRDGLMRKVAFIKSGEEDWTYIEGLEDVKDIVYSNGLFYVLDGWGMLYSCDVSKDLKVRRITSPENNLCCLVLHLVESPEGDFLRIIRQKYTGKFVIHKLVWFSKNPRWEEVTSLGDVALFLGQNHSTSVVASDFAGCRPNSIYFIKPCRYPDYLHANVYVVSLNDRTVTRLYPRSESPLLWISPKFR
ncbi:hypothetical protein PVL29_008456 [Vitis rotundifolia]|uniref:KIB1-4 beta-propeller domain-containing protein n=1 Tax=Vitis rotundifolia TaxID=103349 RepID=A0AA38ZVT5_VITRO|nr:hypothetical protein PVL29_008456 [Vitis rotundifolia]